MQEEIATLRRYMDKGLKRSVRRGNPSQKWLARVIEAKQKKDNPGAGTNMDGREGCVQPECTLARMGSG